MANLTHTHTQDYVAEIQMSYKVERQKPYSDHKIQSSRDAKDYFITWMNQNNYSIEYREYMAVCYLNRRNNILGFNLISIGGISGTVADMKLIFQGAWKTNASAFVLFHNHPSGNTLPSATDNLLTKRINEAAKTNDFVCIDHLIVTVNSFYSYQDEGAL